MKIVSTLECSVRMEKYLGFDAIIYQNEYMFAMEKGKIITSVSGELYERLKGCIETLHSYGIIHFDIKPENITYSPYYSKAVFIDFGFSDVV
jgi:serine/threonine protein kinase